MTFILNQSDWNELRQQAPQSHPDNLVLDEFEEFMGLPEYIGCGYCRELDLSPGISMSFLDWESHQDWRRSVTAHEHPIQIAVCLSGFLHCDIHPSFSETRSYFSGSGISPAYVEQHRKEQHLMLVDIEILPELLDSFFPERQCGSDPLKQLFKGENWKVSFYPKTSAKMRSLAQQMWNAPYSGAAKRMYLQGKVFELLAMQLDLVAGQNNQPNHRLKCTTIDRIYHAREIILADLENPPSLQELAQQVGVSVCTLQRKFQELFGMTVFGYLTDQRMELAEQLLRQGHCTVAEIAAIVGYSNLGHFAAAFKRKVGITPSDCLAGRKRLLG